VQMKEFVPDGIKDYLRLIANKLRYRGRFIGSPTIGNGATLGRGCYIVRGAQISSTVRLLEFCSVNRGALLRSGEFGRFCSIAPYAIMGPQEHPTGFLSTSSNPYAPDNIFGVPAQWSNIPKPPLIGSDVWIGASAFLREGVRIGRTVVGAGAIVTRDVPPYAIVAGAPAKLIRFRFPPSAVAEHLEARWWERSLEELKARAEIFHRPFEFVSIQDCTQ